MRGDGEGAPLRVAVETRGSAALAEARLWLGTPYQHGASMRGVGCDCLGLVRGVWRTLYGAEPEAAPPYAADWAETCAGEPLLRAMRRWFVEVPVDAAGPGDVLTFHMAPGAAVKHLAIVSAGGERIIHAYWGRAVVESWLQPWWRRRVVAAFRWADGAG